MKILFAFGLTLGIAVGGCSTVTSCDASIVPAIRLAINDGQTGNMVTGAVTVRWTGPNVLSDSISVILEPGAQPLAIGFLAGTYSLTVRHAGYNDWNQSVDVVGGGCKPQTKEVTASLTPK